MVFGGLLLIGLPLKFIVEVFGTGGLLIAFVVLYILWMKFFVDIY